MLNVKIKNCNNIKNAELSIEENNMNIFFGRNGSGKSTIAKAILLSSEGRNLADLLPYGINAEDAKPIVEGVTGKKIVVFNNDYIKRYVYQKDSVLENTFNILVRTPDYDDAKKAIDKELADLKTILLNDEITNKLMMQLQIFLEKIKAKEDGSIIKRGGVKAILEGKGAFFNPPKELECMKPFFDSQDVTEWAIWRRNGYDKFGQMKLCPYCSSQDNEKTDSRNKKFSELFDKSSVETAEVITTFLKNLSEFIDASASERLKEYFGVNGDKKTLEGHLKVLHTEAEYLFEKLKDIQGFNGSVVKKEEISELEKNVSDFRIDVSLFGMYFKSDSLKKYIEGINKKIDGLLNNIGRLKGEIGKYNDRLQKQIKSRTEDINDFLSLAGFRYCFCVELRGEDNALAKLKYVLPDESLQEMETPSNHLSWGEQNAFALIMFMFDALSQNADIIVLDDPISSFDRNKKYAIINRLFKTGDSENSLYMRTVLLLTHDFEPVIDYVKAKTGRQDARYNCAYYITNVEGLISCEKIEDKTDILSTVVLLKEIAMDKSMHILARTGSLRKFIEHQCVEVNKDYAYNILSNLTHGRKEAGYIKDNDRQMLEDEIQKGVNYIKQFIDDFDYDALLAKYDAATLLKECGDESKSPYERLLILRAYVERDPEARERLKRYNDVLRKYVDETFHVENDYLFSLDVRKYDIVPAEYSKYAKEFVEKETQRSLVANDSGGAGHNR